MIYTAEIDWSLQPGEDFLSGRYSRGHTLHFDGGVTVPASASPQAVGKWAVAAAVDPEEMLVAALSNCHMLTFLHLARLAGHVVTRYHDHAEGRMAAIAPDRYALVTVVLRPAITWSGTPPDAAALDRLHQAAHHDCYIANSVTTTVTVAP